MWNSIIKNLPKPAEKVNKEKSTMPTLTESDKRVKMYVMGAYGSPIDRIIRIKMLQGVI